MKKIFITVTTLLLTLTCFILCSCETENDEPNVPTVEELIALNYNDICTSCQEDSDVKDIISYLSDWALDNNIEKYKTDEGILVLNTEKDKTPSYALLCEIDENNLENDFQYISAMMYILDNTDKSIRAAVVPSGKEKNIPDEISSCENIIMLDYSKDKLKVTTQGACSASYVLSEKANYTSTKYDTAYKITIKGLNGGKVGKEDGSHPNALLTINNVLASCKSSGLNYQLKYLKGGKNSDSFTGKASALVVISKSDEEKFEKKLDKSISKFESKWDDQEEYYTYTYEKVKKPSKVLNTATQDNLVSLLYTMINGTYAEDEEEDLITGYSNIGKVNIENGKIIVKMNTYAREKNIMTEMHSSIKTLAEMSDFNVKRKNTTPLWSLDENSKLLKALVKASEEENVKLPDEYSSALKISSLSYIKKKNEEANVISIGTDFSTWEDVANMLLSLDLN